MTFPIGMNMQGGDIFANPEQAFLNIMHTCEVWSANGNSDGWNYHNDSMNLDSDGYPMDFNTKTGSIAALNGNTSFQIFGTNQITTNVLSFQVAPYYRSGTYSFLFDGTGSFLFGNDAAITVDQSGGGPTIGGTTPGRYLLNLTPSAQGVQILIRGIGAGGTYPKNMRLVYAPLATSTVVDQNEIDVTAAEAGDLSKAFNPDFLSKVAPFPGNRFMDWGSEQQNQQTNWTDRTLPTNLFWNIVPWEVMIALCNKLNHAPWFTFPMLANDAYATSMANLLLSGTGPYAGLDNALSFYLEWGNEVMFALYNQNILDSIESSGYATFPLAKSEAASFTGSLSNTGIIAGIQDTSSPALFIHGSGYVDGIYTNVPLTGGGGTGAQATIQVAGTMVVNVVMTAGGTGYAVGDALSASNANLGGSGSGFSVNVTQVLGTLHVTAISVGAMSVGSTIFGTSIAANTATNAQITTQGGDIATYYVTKSQTVASEAMTQGSDSGALRYWSVYRAINVCKLFRDVFAGSPSRVIRALGGMDAGSLPYGSYNLFALTFQSDGTFTGGPGSRGGPAEWYTGGGGSAAHNHFDVFGIAPYFDLFGVNVPGDGSVTVDEVFTQLDTGGMSWPGANPTGQLQLCIDRTAACFVDSATYGIPIVAYEGGQQLNSLSNNNLNTLYTAVNRDARMGPLYTRLLTDWGNRGGGLFLHECDISTYNGGYFGALENVYQTSTPKYDALLNFINPPATVPGGGHSWLGRLGSLFDRKLKAKEALLLGAAAILKKNPVVTRRFSRLPAFRPEVDRGA